MFQINQNGYIYVYSCNTSAMTVRTDNLFIAHYQGSLLEEFHYYPFGMCFDVSKSPVLGKSAAVKYNSQLHEHDEFEDANGNVYGLEDYNFAFRNYDAQIGRWLQPDPLMQHPSPYLAMSNNPVSFTDPTGLWDDPIINSRGELVGDDGLNNGKYYMLDHIISVEDNINNKIYQTYHVHEISRDEYYSKKISYAGGMIMMSANGGYKQMGEAYGEQTAWYNVNHFNWAQGLIVNKSSETPWMFSAISQLGQKEATNNNDGANVLKFQKSAGLKSGDPWCGAFVNWSLSDAKVKGVKGPGRALNWRGYGEVLNKPAYGSIGTLKRPGGGHVGFVAGLDAGRPGWVIMIGGNQSNSVSYQSFPINIMQFNYPKGFSPGYKLPKLSGYPRGVRMQ